MANKEFYRNAKAYDIAFGKRDYKQECDFAEWCLKTHSSIPSEKIEKSFLELCCGPAAHAREFTRRGWKCTALDLSEDMLDYAEAEAKAEGLDLEYVQADMADFSLKEKVSLVSNYTESITHLTTNEQILAHFRAIRENVVSGGIYIIELAHPRFFFPFEEPNVWTEKQGDTEVEILFGLPEDEYNTVTQTWNITTRMTVRTVGQEPYTVESKSRHRWYLCQEFKALIELSGAFDFYTFYGNVNIPPRKLDDTWKSDCMTVVLRVK